jgi:hypothetical protein
LCRRSDRRGMVACLRLEQEERREEEEPVQEEEEEKA